MKKVKVERVPSSILSPSPPGPIISDPITEEFRAVSSRFFFQRVGTQRGWPQCKPHLASISQGGGEDFLWLLNHMWGFYAHQCFRSWVGTGGILLQVCSRPGSRVAVG